mmetsp:Transcript_17758/g.26898  ORF Transcript_17758/g.26898 Transcript_17758/m.26898 type:complete len:341 (-) Transcript_17758:187-1209(-)
MKSFAFILLLLAAFIGSGSIVDAAVKTSRAAATQKKGTNEEEPTEKSTRFDGIILVSLLTVGAMVLLNKKKKESACQKHPNAFNILNAVQRDHFKGAVPSSTILEQVEKVMSANGYTPENTLFAQSVCPDEINHEVGDLTDLFTKYLGEVFHMGGLAGVPFTGKTGFGAFSHHVPDAGHCFVLMAPHVGIDDAAQLGKYSRIGQSGGPGAACGAAVGAYKCACSGKALPSLTDCDSDYQMTYLIHEVNKVKNDIQSCGDHNSQQAELVRQCHRIGKDMLDQIVNVDFGSDTSTLVVLTGVQINMPRPFDDYFQPLSFFTLDKKGGETDLFAKTFGSSVKA